MVLCQNLPPKPLGDEILGVEFSTSDPIFLESVDFGPLFRAFSESLGVGLQRPQIWCTYVQKQKNWGPEYITAPFQLNALDARASNHKIGVDPITLLNTLLDGMEIFDFTADTLAHGTTARTLKILQHIIQKIS